MKYTSYLESKKTRDFFYYYLDYRKLEDIVNSDPYKDDTENMFISELELNMSRVFDFINVKKGEYTQRFDELEKKAKPQMESLKPEINALQDEIRIFMEFIKINIVGFKRILKKHDKKTPYKLKPMYKKKIRRKSEELENLDELFYRISKIVLTVTKLDPGSEISVQTFIRNTNKYWVPKKNILPLKSLIVRHLPIYVFSSKKDDTVSKKSESSIFPGDIDKELESPYHGWNPKLHDTCVSSVYFDNKDFDLYKGRLRKIQGAEAIRIRWYTAQIQEIVFVERKRHEEDWTGEESKKLRFKMPERLVNEYINGKNVWKRIESLNQEDKDDSFLLYTEIQNSIQRKRLRPVLRTFYKRTAFQFPNSAAIRISLDTHLCMIKEAFDFESPVKSWRRLDVNCEHPFFSLNDKEIVRFPHGVLEVKLQSSGDDRAKWIEDITSGNYVEHVDKFSKYIHGCSILFPQIIDIPYWLPQYHKDISISPYDCNTERHVPKNDLVLDINSAIKDAIVTPNSDNSSRMDVVDVENRRIAIPVRVEPKVYFANERTFLSWLHFSIFIGGIGTAMMGLGDHRAVMSGIIFIAVSIMFALYALYLFFWRAGMIRLRDPGPYDDLYGPAVLVAVFLAAMVLSIVFKFPFR